MHPTLYQINARVWLNELSSSPGKTATFDDVDDEQLEQWAARGFDWIWLTGVWQTGPAGRAVSLTLPEWRTVARELHFQDADVCGSPFAVRAYEVHVDFGGNESLARLRDRMRQRGLRLMLDFVPNHTALDHGWVYEHPEYYVAGTSDDARNEPHNFARLVGPDGVRVLAYGRDPFFSGWTDTLQLNYRHAGLRQAMIGELLRIAHRCDGVRCDMAMLILPNVFRRTWGDRALPADGGAPVDVPFWPEAIGRVRAERPDFTFLSEVYWNLEATLQQQGFDYTYDKTWYDRLRSRDVDGLRDHLKAPDEYHCRSAHFLENHDEPPAAAVFDRALQQAAAVLTCTLPGLRFFHDGQLEGRRIKTWIHLGRRVQESPDPVLRDFYGQLLHTLRRAELRHGRWQTLECRQAWDDNPTARGFLAYQWRGEGDRRLWVVANLGQTQGQCYLIPADDSLRGRSHLLRDQLSRTWYERDGDELATRGLFLDMPSLGYHVFDVEAT